MAELNADERDRYLGLLSIFHYVVAGLLALFSCFPLIHLAAGLAMLASEAGPGEVFPGFIGVFFVAFSSVAILGGWTLAVFIALTGRYLKRRKHYTFCLVMGGVECLFMPFGTVLGVFTIIMLVKPEVKQQEFGQADEPPPGSEGHDH